jgi:hypothetical protein
MFQTLIDPAFLAAENGGTPVLDLNFAALKALDSRITFTRASSGTYLDSSGILQTAASGSARFTHDPATGRSLGLLIESGRTNLLTYSEAINNAAWSHVGGTHNANQTTAPSGELTADLFTENSAASTQHRLLQTPTVANGTTYTVSVFVKRASGSRQFGITLTTTTAVARVYFNLDTGTVGTVVSGSGTITAYPNGWYRCTATGVSDGLTGTTFFQLCNGTTSGSETYTGDGTSGLYIWGTQLEAGAFSTSYIQTISASASRSADSVVMTGTNFSSWYNQSQGTISLIAAQGFTLPSSTFLRPFDISNSGGTDRIGAYTTFTSPDNRAYVQAATGGSVFAEFAPTGALGTGSFGLAISYSTTAVSAAINGNTSTSDTTVSSFTPDRLTLGAIVAQSSNSVFNGTIARFRYFNRALPSSVQAISA